jgi:hypothetical protein
MRFPFLFWLSPLIAQLRVNEFASGADAGRQLGGGPGPKLYTAARHFFKNPGRDVTAAASPKILRKL